MFKTSQKYSFDSQLFELADVQVIEQYRQHVRPLLKPKCDYLLVTRNGRRSEEQLQGRKPAISEAKVKESGDESPGLHAKTERRRRKFENRKRIAIVL